MHHRKPNAPIGLGAPARKFCKSIGKQEAQKTRGITLGR